MPILRIQPRASPRPRLLRYALHPSVLHPSVLKPSVLQPQRIQRPPAPKRSRNPIQNLPATALAPHRRSDPRKRKPHGNLRHHRCQQSRRSKRRPRESLRACHPSRSRSRSSPRRRAIPVASPLPKPPNSLHRVPHALRSPLTRPPHPLQSGSAKENSSGRGNAGRVPHLSSHSVQRIDGLLVRRAPGSTRSCSSAFPLHCSPSSSA